MVKLNEDFIFRLKNLCDITTVVSKYVNLIVSGKNKKSCCPFHSEKTPSFVVFEDTQSFYCFGCGVGGDVITFVEKIENLEYLEAVKFLAKFSGLSLPQDGGFDDEKIKQRKNILKINRVAAKFYFSNLYKKSGRQGLSYLLNKRALKKSTIVKFGLGFALESWCSLKDHLKEKGFSFKDMEQAGLVLKSKNGSYYDRFRNRVIFPIIDLKGDVVAFGARAIDETAVPKYLNSSQSLVFKKGFGLFALNFAKNSSMDYFLLCEGYMDVVTLFQNGFDMAVASLGTSLTKQQARLLCRNGKGVIVAYDMDGPGEIAVDKASLIFEELGVEVKVLKFKGAKDPDEYIKRFGVASFKNAVETAVSVEKSKLNVLIKKCRESDADGKKKFVAKYCDVLSNIKDPLKRDIYVGELCKNVGLDRYIVINHINHLMQKKKERFEKKEAGAVKVNLGKNFKDKDYVPLRLVKAQEGIIRFLYCNPDKLFLVLDLIDENYFNFKWSKLVYSFLKEAIISKKNLDISIFHEVLDKEEMGRLCKVINESNIFKNTVEELRDYVNVLKNYNERKDVLSMSLEQIEKVRRDKAALKAQ